MTNPTRWFYCALAFSAIFHVWHALLLPIVVTYDGNEYLRLASLLHSPMFYSEYDFARTPLYPLALKVSFLLFGRQALAAELPNFVLGFSGICLLAFSIRRLGHTLVAAASVVLLSIFPLLVAYEHTILTEAGTFFCLALIISGLLWGWAGTDSQFPNRKLVSVPALKTLALAGAVALGFYFRPTVLYLAPVVGLAHGLDLLHRRDAESAENSRKNGQHDSKNPFFALRPLSLCGEFSPRCRAGAHALAVCILPFVLAWPWNRLLAASPQRNAAGWMMVYGLLKQAVLPPEHPVIGSHSGAYAQAIAECSPGGRLSLSGLTQRTLVRFQWDLISPELAGRGRAVLLSAIRDYPGRYAAGMARTALFLYGLPGLDDENANYFQGAIRDAGAGAKHWGAQHPLYPDTAAHLVQKTDSSVISETLTTLAPLFDILVVVAAGVTVLGFLAGCRRLDLPLIVLTAVPLAFVLLHAIILLSSHRYAVPAWAIFLVNLVFVPVRLWGRQPREKA